MKHVVRPGETLGDIAARYGTTVRAIMRANGLKNPNMIYANQVLNIPKATKSPSKSGVPKPTSQNAAQYGVPQGMAPYGAYPYGMNQVGQMAQGGQMPPQAQWPQGQPQFPQPGQVPYAPPGHPPYAALPPDYPGHVAGAPASAMTGGMPGWMPGGMHGGTPGTMPGWMPGGMHGGTPGTMPGWMPGGMQGPSGQGTAGWQDPMQELLASTGPHEHNPNVHTAPRSKQPRNEMQDRLVQLEERVKRLERGAKG